jgi:diacylglycerol kinase (ATP)
LNRPRIVIAYNPKSGSFDQMRLGKLQSCFVSAGYDASFADSHSDDLLPAVAAAQHLCVVGGDGTLRDVVARIQDAKNFPSISVYPAGTINLVAREAKYPANISKFVARVTGGMQTRRHYHCELGGGPMLVCASVGPDSIAVASVSGRLKSRIGRFAYLAAFGKLLLKWPRQKITILANGETYICEAAFVLNGKFFAGPWQISRDADLTQPQFQLLLLPKARRRDYLRLIAATVLSPALAAKNWLRIDAETAEISGAGGMPVQVDGDIAAMLPIKVTMNPYQITFA